VIVDHLEVRYGGLTMQAADAFALGLTITEIEGWSDGVDGRYDEIDIEGGDGAFDVPVTLGSRLVNVKGYCRATSFADLRGWRDRVTGQIGGQSTRIFTVAELGEAEWAAAQCVRATFPIFGGQTFADFSMSFWMPKPWKFGAETEPFGNGVPATHRGNTGSVPFFRIGGVRPAGYTIAGPAGRAVTVTVPVVDGAPHEYDMSTGELTVGGAFVDGGITVADSWAIPGGGAWAHTISGGSGPFTTLLRKVTI
jgi:hypothetical protein